MAASAAPAWQALLTAGLLLCFSTAGGREGDSGSSTELWAAPDRSLVLLKGGEEGGFWVCPRVDNLNHQPFCRRFDTRVLGACGYSDGLQLVLANGEIHHVNKALIGVDGDFAPVHSPNRPMELLRIWMPVETCFPRDGFNNVLAVATSGELWHFDRVGWRRIAGHRVGLLGSE